MTGMHTSMAASGWIIVSSPSGGIWYNGDTLSISWTSFDAGSAVDIEIYAAGSYYSTIASDVYNSGSYQWSIPLTIPQGVSYQIKVTSSINSSISDYSTYFSIYERSITITSPTGGETIFGDDTYTIRWETKNLYDSVYLYLFKGDTSVSYLAYISSQYIKSFSWWLGDSLTPGSTYRIKIISSSHSEIFDYSDYFTIDQRTITITSPEQDSTWYLGETYQIAWQSHHAGDIVDIILNEDKGDNMVINRLTIASDTSNDESYLWTVPSSLPLSSAYYILIVSKSYHQITINAYDKSEIFTIAERYIHVTSPASSETWFVGESYNITWAAKNAGDKVNIEFFRSGVMETLLAVNISNAGWYLWSIPEEFPIGTTCNIKIRSTKYSTLFGISAYFSVERKSISVSPPTENEKWYKGEQYKIIWTSKGVTSPVKIELFLEGVSTRMISSNTSNTGEFLWTIPTDIIASSQYQIKITSLGDEQIYGFTQGYLPIENTFLQQWLGTIILLTGVSVAFAIIYVFIFKKWRDRIAAESTESESQLNKTWATRLSEEEYERIWENKRD